MSDASNDRASEPLRHRKSRDWALILPLVGLILLTPPIAGIFQLEATLAGIPITVVYLFTVWAALIAGAAAVSRRLRDGDEHGGHSADQDGAETHETETD